MPKLDELPPLAVIVSLKGVLDFYYWKGIPCVRKWPRIPPAHRTQASLQSAALFGAVIKGYDLLGATLKIFFNEDADDQPRTARDIYISATLGHLHEAPMADILALLTECTAYLEALAHLQETLESVHTDRLLVRGMNQLFSFKGSLKQIETDTISGAGGYLDSDTPPAGEIWRIFNIGAVDITTATTDHRLRVFVAPTSHALLDDDTGWGANARSYHQLDVWLHPGEVIRVYFVGGLAGDTCQVNLLGYIMTLET